MFSGNIFCPQYLLLPLCLRHYKSGLCVDNVGLVGCFNSDIVVVFDSTPRATILSLLIQSLQKVPVIAESHSQQIVPLFLKYLGYNGEEATRCFYA